MVILLMPIVDLRRTVSARTDHALVRCSVVIRGERGAATS